MTRLHEVRWSTAVVSVLALLWLYPVIWTLLNAVRRSADIYRAPWELPLPPALDNLGEAWSRGHLALALANSAYVSGLTVGITLAVAVGAAYALTILRPPLRAALLGLILLPLVVPTETLLVPLFALFRTFGLIDSLPGLAVVNAVGSLPFATLLLSAYFRTLPKDVVEAARVDGAGRLTILLRVVVPLARPGILAVAVLVAVFAWNDFGGALVLLQKPQVFTAQLALNTFSTFYVTDEGLTFAGVVIVSIPPLVLFLLLQRPFLDSLTARAARR